MIGYIKGKVLSIKDGVVLIENNGIGYEVTCSSSAIAKLSDGATGELYTYMAVKEDGVFLYGFSNMEEKTAFLSLITVSGVGPKMGITVLSGMGLNELLYAIASSDVKGLSKVKGLGKKTAERIILELREKVGEIAEAPIGKGKKAEVQAPAVSAQNEDAVIALMSLGFTKAESVNAVAEAERSGADSIEELIAYAIKHIK